jgi:glycosyltransferase involved in cell wall biosynthesis
MASKKDKVRIVYLLPGGLFNPGGMERAITLKANYLADILNYDVTIVTTEQMGRPPFYPLSEKVRQCHLDIGIHERFGKESYMEKIVSRWKKTQEYRTKLSRLLNVIRPHITISMLGLDIGFINNLKDGSRKIGELHFPRNFRSLMANKLSNSLIPNMIAKIRTASMLRQCRRLDRLVVLTEEEKSFWPVNARIEVIPNPLPFFPETTASLSAKKALAVGRLAYEKGFDTLIDAWADAAVEAPDWKLTIYGNGNCRDALQQQIAQRNISNIASIHEPTTNIQKVYLHSSMFIFPSRYLEAMPMVLLEAMSFGLPVVAFDAPCGPKDLIEDGRNGFLVKTGDIPDFIEKINRLRKSPKLRKTMGQEARLFSENFRIEKIMPRWDALFKSLTA